VLLPEPAAAAAAALGTQDMLACVWTILLFATAFHFDSKPCLYTNKAVLNQQRT
jgi:hypothetical protein